MMAKMLEPLTSREQEITTLVSASLSNKEIAQHLKVTEKTVKTHLHQIYRKIGVKDRDSLVAALIRLDLHRE
jgi:DNA-binding CsgD family transcriptional regulator